MTTPRLCVSVSRSLLLSTVLALGACGGSGGGAGGASGAGGSGGASGSGGSRGGAGGSGGTTAGGATGGAGASGGSGGDVGATDAGTGGSPGIDTGGAGGGAPADADTSGGQDVSTASDVSDDAAPTPTMGSSNGCAGGACLNPDCKALGTPAAPGKFPSIGFEAHPSYIPNDVIVPTFDDVPDRPYTSADGQLFTNFASGDWTKQMLDFLEANNLHFDFFINTDNFCDLDKNPGCVDVVKRILKTQNPANHTIHHIHMGTNAYDPVKMFNSGCRAMGMGSKVVCEDEISGVEAVVSSLSDGAINHLTRFRAPYGQPFQEGGGAVGEIQAVVSKFAVHVGWQMESGDADHDEDGKKLGDQFFINAVTRAIGDGPGKGNWGVILMHGTYPWSLGELKALFDPKTGYMQAHKFRVGTVEDAICWKYGMHSWELVSQITGHTIAPN